MNVIEFLYSNWDTVTLVFTNIAALLIKSPLKK